ncbi:MAG: RluA family pseudouridine synthase [bacterium]|jgi:23S rRNA pseudouridine1911/1915/1917 synthase
MKKISIDVLGQSLPQRIDKYLSTQVSELSRSRIQQLIAAGDILLNQQRVLKVSEKVKSGDRIEVHIPPPASSSIQPEPIPLEILYEDSQVVAINKPPGLCVHPTESITTGTLVNALLYHIRDLSGIGGVMRPGIVHRLDRVTSGILLAAKTDSAHQALSMMFKQRKMKKTYWAIVHGKPPQSEGEINLPIGRHPTERKRMAIRPDGRISVTRYKILREGLGGSWIEVYPLTGRTHQIRVHLRHLGCPVVRDVTYATRKHQGKGSLERALEGYPGIALHARSLEFLHPVTGEQIRLEAALPDQLQSVVVLFG